MPLGNVVPKQAASIALAKIAEADETLAQWNDALTTEGEWYGTADKDAEAVEAELLLASQSRAGRSPVRSGVYHPGSPSLPD